ncbi:MarR family winged helix-turn-helix transcriptional regulator [Nocardioides insulae]|uniref:MarR family winged helix-turn-helix transcriptional regulator n=1 Tax=Nocardioides insulae TaxID=394734 RepID=UPI00041A4E85|nr:MarR family transcriptional regulator [Nocardioides insulae]
MSASLSPRQEIWRGLLLGQRSMLTGLASELKKDYGLTVAAYEALLSLWEAPEHTLQATQLAHSLVYSSGSASNLIGRLVQAGHVVRRAGAHDARIVEVSLTPRGRDLVERATKAHRASIAREFEPLVADAEIATLLAFARRLAEREGVTAAP